MKKTIKNRIKESLFSFLIIVSIGIFIHNSSRAESVENTTCLDCHEEMAESLRFTPHKLENNSIEMDCVSCHAGGEVHIEDPSVDNIMNPKNSYGDSTFSACSGCHKPHSDLDNFGFDSHQIQQLNCNSCHLVHGGKKALLLDDKMEFCLPCHSETKTKFARRSNHPVKQSVMTCLSCHRFIKKQDYNFAYDLNRICQDCHPEQGGPFLHEHEPVNGYSVEGSGCIECHDPHGSENDRLLKQKGNDLCRQCHVEHITRNHASQWDLNWSKLACQSCHTDTHGSFTNSQYLDPNLEVKFGGNCFNIGCHVGSN